MKRESAAPPSRDETAPSGLEQPARLKALLSSGTLPHDAWKSLEGNQGFARVGPLPQLFDGDMVARFTAGAVSEKGAGYVHHPQRAGGAHR